MSMCSLLLFAVLFAVLLQPAAASSSIMELTPPGSPLDLPFHVDELMLCTCGMQWDFCVCLQNMPQFTYNDAATFLQPHDSTAVPLTDTLETGVNMALVENYVIEDDRPPLNNEYMQFIDANETTVQPITVQAHIEDTYTPGDRSSSSPPSHRPKPRKQSHRRQAPRKGGFVCDESGCNDVFNRQCDLNRHHKTSHLNERPHLCSTCGKGFLYPKDLRRHMHQHSDPLSVKVTFRCEHPDCTNLDGFSRKDNLQRHQRKRHPSR